MRQRQREKAVQLDHAQRGLLVRAAFKRLMRPPSRNDHIYLFSSAENARRLMETLRIPARTVTLLQWTWMICAGSGV